MRTYQWLVLAAMLTLPVAAQELLPMELPPEKAPAAHAGPAYPHPILPAPDSFWPAFVLAFVGVMFVTAASIGSYYRIERPEEIPPTHSHDEPPGASGHHGKGGTQNPAPEHGHHH